ncbi:hypothetical protein KQX54_019547 [Cotesia glomerata]|uniref:Uncharacterized protein n=1 Tax=Cotesia glomerata TaxID=32391 RepID=A0AAV7I3W4_COTGL|nr:hypothetical protein KQX54_019547 [Cotesia glomerata]
MHHIPAECPAELDMKTSLRNENTAATGSTSTRNRVKIPGVYRKQPFCGSVGSTGSMGAHPRLKTVLLRADFWDNVEFVRNNKKPAGATCNTA